jgi:pimeloyl-ACP methyl ester carboxylesterase
MSPIHITSLMLAALVTALTHVTPMPPEQPSTGPGGTAYAHASVATSRLGSAAEEVYLFEPADPKPERAPVVIFCHGWGGMDPDLYGAWITHIVRRGATVIYPRYQIDLRTPVADFTPNALSATKRALEELRASGHVIPDERGLAFVGHSMGGLVAANLAVRAAQGDLPPPLVLMSVEPGRSWPEGATIAMPLDDLSVLPSSLLLVTMAGQDDDVVRDVDARKIYASATRVPQANKDYVRMLTDLHGDPQLRADHTAPTAPSALIGDGLPARDRRERATDALDFFGTWKIFDGLVDAVFHGTHREYALGNTPEQRFMGYWSDGASVRELIVGWP